MSDVIEFAKKFERQTPVERYWEPAYVFVSDQCSPYRARLCGKSQVHLAGDLGIRDVDLSFRFATIVNITSIELLISELTMKRP